MKIGQLVQNHIGQIFRYCEGDSSELTRLIDPRYCKRTFDLDWHFCTEVGEILPKEHKIYWVDRYDCGDKRLRVCSQWYERHRKAFCWYLLSKGIIDKNKLITLIEAGESIRNSPRPVKSAGSNGIGSRRHGSIHIGDAQNAFIRVILSRLGQESFDEADWQSTIEYFLKSCAYCGDSVAALEMDHGTPINKAKLGEHRLGNVIPSCRKCNKDKHRRDYKQFLGENIERIARIEAYVPLGDHDQIKSVLEEAHKEVSALAERYVAIINGMLADKPLAGPC